MERTPCIPARCIRVGVPLLLGSEVPLRRALPLLGVLPLFRVLPLFPTVDPLVYEPAPFLLPESSQPRLHPVVAVDGLAFVEDEAEVGRKLVEAGGAGRSTTDSPARMREAPDARCRWNAS